MRSPFFSSLGHSLGLMILGMLTLASTPGVAAPEPQVIPLSQFYSVPRLIYTGTNRDWAQAYRPTYYFTLLFPPSEGAALGAVDLMQIEGLPIVLIPEETIAFRGTRKDPEEPLPATVESLRGDGQTGLRLHFNEPVLPGQTLTLAVRARSNPYQDGIYQYALVAYPQENLRDGYTLGIGRLNFYENTRFRF